VSKRDDGRLREAFHAYRAEVRGSGRIPQFDEMIARAREAGAQTTIVPIDVLTRRRSPWIAAASVAAAAAAATVLLMSRGEPQGDVDFERLVMSYSTSSTGSGWVSPTAELLDVPGSELLRGMPAIRLTPGLAVPGTPVDTPEDSLQETI
jgi:hypothetical protein